MNKRNIIILVVIVVVVAGVVYLLSTGAIPSPRVSQAPTEGEGVAGPVGESVAPGASPITEEGQVVTQEGAPVELDVLPGSPEAPQQSNPISEALEDSIKLTITASGVSPSNFEVRSGAAATISVTSGDTQTHIFKFDDPDLSAVAVGVGPGETRAITFNAPKKGEYSFFCDVPGHKTRGETGTMTVR